MLVRIQMKVNESIYAIIQMLRTYLSLALLIIKKKKKKLKY